MITNEVKEICFKIGHFYLLKNNGDYVAANAEINKIQFTKVEIVWRYNIWNNIEKAVEVTVARPGIFIGMRGENYEKLQTYLGCKLSIQEARDNIVDYIYVEPPMEWSENYLLDYTDETKYDSRDFIWRDDYIPGDNT